MLRRQAGEFNCAVDGVKAYGRACVAAVMVVLAAGAGTAAAGTPVPLAAAGSGSGSTRALGALAGRPFAARAAIVERDFYGDLNVYLFASRRGCGGVSSSDAPYVWISLDSGGHKLAVGKRLVSGRGMRIAANISRGSHQMVVLSEGVSIVFTHADPRVASVWHGSIRIRSALRRASVFSGSFAARWCGEV